MKYPSIWPQFFTASIQQKFELLKDYEYKNIITSSLKFLVNDNRIDLSAFVVMSNHVHITCLPAGRFGNHCNITL